MFVCLYVVCVLSVCVFVWAVRCVVCVRACACVCVYVCVCVSVSVCVYVVYRISGKFDAIKV